MCPCHSKCSCRITPRYFTVENKFIFPSVILQFKCLGIVFCFGLRVTISVLLVIVLEMLNHDFLKNLSQQFIYQQQVGIICKMMYLLDITYVTDKCKLLMNMINSKGLITRVSPLGEWRTALKIKILLCCQLNVVALIQAVMLLSMAVARLLS